jgi:hypothetical protein
MFPQTAQFFHAGPAKHFYLLDVSSDSPVLPCRIHLTILPLRCFLRQPSSSLHNLLNNFTSQMFPQTAQFFPAESTKQFYLSDVSSDSPALPCRIHYTILPLRCFLRQPSSSMQQMLNIFTSQMFPQRAQFFHAGPAKHFKSQLTVQHLLNIFSTV